MADQTKLQKKGTRSAKRLLKQLSGKEARFAKDVNHTISKHVVTLRVAPGTRCAIALEDLSGIRQRVTVGRDQRATLHTRSGSFFQRRMFLAYKAQLAGVTVIPVDPRNTSRTVLNAVVSINPIVPRKVNSPVCPVDFLDSQITSRLEIFRVGRLSTRQT